MSSEYDWVLGDANSIRLDLFPARIEENGQYIGEVFRVIATDQHFYILDEGNFGAIAKVAEPYSSIDGTNKTGYTVTTGRATYSISRAVNCGCGSRLRGIHPFAGVPYVPLV